MISHFKIEKVAQAVYGEYQRRAIKYGWTVVGTVLWGDLAASAREDYRSTARAVLEALE